MKMEEYLVSKKNKPKFTYNGYLLVFDKHRKKDPIMKLWQCERKKMIAKLIYTLRTM